MGQRIRYKLCPGDILTYQKDVTLLLQEPDGLRQDGTTCEKLVYKILSSDPVGWTIQLSSSPLSAEGELVENLADELKDVKTSLRMTARGELFDHEPNRLPHCPPVFSEEEVEQGMSWCARFPGVGPETHRDIQFALERLEDRAGESVAHLVSLCLSKEEEGEVEVEIQAATEFSVTRGHQLASTTVTKTSWPNGRVCHTVVEINLQNRSSLRN